MGDPLRYIDSEIYVTSGYRANLVSMMVMCSMSRLAGAGTAIGNWNNP